LAGVPGAHRTTYFASTTQSGVGQAITMRAGDFVDLLSFFSAASGTAHPISPADAEQVAVAQHKAMVAAPGGTTPLAAASSGKRVTLGSVGLAAVAVVVLAVALLTPVMLRRRRGRADAGGPPDVMRSDAA